MQGSNTQAGYALITSLLFLLVLTIVAVTTLRMTTLDVRMSTNLTERARAFEHSDSARLLSTDVLEEHISNRGWPATAIDGSVPDLNFSTEVLDLLDSTVTDNGQMSVLLKASAATDAPPGNLYDSNNPEGSGGDILYGAISNDLLYQFDGNSDSSFDGETDINATIGVYRTKQQIATGAGTAMISGYEGLGKGLAAGGGNVLFELRSVGASGAAATSQTASEYRHVIRN